MSKHGQHESNHTQSGVPRKGVDHGADEEHQRGPSGHHSSVAGEQRASRLVPGPCGSSARRHGVIYVTYQQPPRVDQRGNDHMHSASADKEHLRSSSVTTREDGGNAIAAAASGVSHTTTTLHQVTAAWYEWFPPFSGRYSVDHNPAGWWVVLSCVRVPVRIASRHKARLLCGIGVRPLSLYLRFRQTQSGSYYLVFQVN